MVYALNRDNFWQIDQASTLQQESNRLFQLVHKRAHTLESFCTNNRNTYSMTTPTPLSKTLLKVIPISFAAGAAMELFMIYGRVGSETFYDTAKRLESERRSQRSAPPTTSD